MKRTAVIAIAVLAGVVLAGWLLWEDFDAGREKPTFTGSPILRTDTAEAADESASRTERARAETGPAPIVPRAFREDAPEDVANPFPISGRVLDHEDRPVSGVKVQLRIYDGYEAVGQPIVERSRTSDAEGSFGFNVKRPDRTVTIAAAVIEADFSGSQETEVAIHGDPPPAPLVLRALRHDAEIVGRISDTAGNAIPDAIVGWGREVPADAEGNYRYRIVAGRTTWFSARAPGFARKEAQLAAVLPGSSTTFDLVLDREGIVTGVVRSRDGVPVAMAHVSGWASSRVETRTDAAGTFKLVGFDVGREHHLITVEAEGFQQANIHQLTFVEREAKVEVTLDRGAEIRGVVTTRQGAAVEGAEVRLGAPNFVGTIVVRTDRDGRFRFGAVKTGACELVASRRGHADTAVTVTVPDLGQAMAEVRIVLADSRRVGGLVTDPKGTPVPGISVASRVRGEYAGHGGRTDSRGRFALHDLPAAGLSLEFYGKGWRRVVHEVPVPRDDLTFVVERAGRLAGRVVEAGSRAPVGRFRIRIVPPDVGPGEQRGYGYSTTWSDKGHVFTDTDGFWQIDDDLTPGAIFGVEASADGFAPARAPRVAASVDPAKDAVLLELRPAASISGTAVVEGNGRPLADATIFVTTPADEKSRAIDRGWNPAVSVRSDAAGYFRLTSVPPGEIRIVGDHPDYPQAVIGPVQIAEGQHLDSVRLTFSAGAMIEGTCRGEDGKPIASAPVSVDGSALRKSKATTADGAGRFAFRGLPAGFHYVTATLGGDHWNSITLPVTLTEGETKTVVLALDGPCSLRIDVESDEETGTQLYATLRPKAEPGEKPGTRAHRRVPIGLGGAEVPGLAPGPYDVSVDERNPRSPRLHGSAPVTLEAGKKAEVRIPLKRT
jgi:protocatechuate 3,4-dioxygenase beta subunit